MDEFASLEAVATLGLLVVAIRTAVLFRAVGAIGEDHEALLAELARADRTRAYKLLENSASAGYSDVAIALLERAGELAGATPEEVRGDLAAVLDEAHALQVRRANSGRGRDLVILALLVGTVAYVARANWHATLAFYAVATGIAVTVVVGLVARSLILSRVRERHGALLEAVAAAAMTPTTAAPSGPCAMCGGTQYVAVQHPERVRSEGASAALGLDELHICARCGFVRGRVSDPDAITVGTQTDTVLCTSPSEEAPALGTEGEEHEG